MHIKMKRIYEPYLAADGYRVLVDQLWPRVSAKQTPGSIYGLKRRLLLRYYGSGLITKRNTGQIF